MIDRSKSLGCQNIHFLLLWQVEALHSQAKHKIQNDDFYRISNWFKELICYCVMKCSQRMFYDVISVSQGHSKYQHCLLETNNMAYG